MPADKRRERLAPGAIAKRLFCLDPDRDERAPQLCAEMLLTMVSNRYESPCDPQSLVTPKRQRFAVRSLAVGENFLHARTQGRAGDSATTPQGYGSGLAAGADLRGSANLGLARRTLEGLIDPETRRGQKGTWLLRPFHESLLWYDARRSPQHSPWTVRKVYMRGSGITLARMLMDPPAGQARELGRSAVEAIRVALTSASLLAEVSSQLEAALPEGEPYTTPPATEEDERDAWNRGADQRLSGLAERLCRHAEGVMGQPGASAPARLWQLRTVLALDLALHVVSTAWEKTQAPPDERFLLLSFGGSPRAVDQIRQRSEESYRRARIRLNEATVLTLADGMEEIAGESRVDWPAEFQARSNLGSDDEASVTSQLRRLPARPSREDYERIARTAVESANYSRAAGDGFRVLLESAGMLVGTGLYRYLTAGPDLLAATVGALSAQMPMPSRKFFATLRDEWGLVVNQESASSTSLATALDGAGLERNARKAEKLMSDAGLALGLSDRTTMVGERAARRHR